MNIAKQLSALLLGLAIAGSVSARPFAYSGDGDTTGGNLYRIDLANNSLTTVGPMADVLLEGLSFGPGGTTLYGIDDSADALYIINTTTAATTLVGSLGIDEADPGMSLCPDNNIMYLSGESGNLYSINLATGAATPIGPTGLNITGLACSVSGQLYGYDDSDDNLYAINRTTGAATLIGPLGFDSADGGLGFNGSQLLLVNDGAPTNLYRVNTSTGAATLITQLSPDDLSFESMAVDEEAAGGVISPTQIPTLSEWGMIILSSLLALGTVLVMRRQRL